VREKDVFHDEPVAIYCGKQFGDLVARINDDRFPCFLTTDDKAVFEEGWGGAHFENH